MIHSHKQRLAAYASFSACFLAIDKSAEAQFGIYTDIEPDSSVSVAPISPGIHEGQLMMDLDGDGFNDFAIFRGIRWNSSYDSFSDQYVLQAGFPGQVNEIVGYTTPYSISGWAQPFMAGDTIKNSTAFEDRDWHMAARNGTSWSLSGGPWGASSLWGPLNLGIRIEFDGAWQYGWITVQYLEVNGYALNPIPDAPILADLPFDSTFAKPAHTIRAKQLGVSGSFADFQLSFKVPVSELGTSEYRVIPIKKDSLPSFDLATALSLPTDRYQSLPITGTDYNLTLSSGLMDTDGDAMQMGLDYHFLVMSMADGIITTNHNLWSCSPAYFATAVDRAATSIVVVDTADHNDGRDMHISFTKATNETGINQYRVFLWKSSLYPELALISGLPTNHYLDILPNGSNHAFAFPSTLLDAEGDSVRSDIDYLVYVQSLADGIVLPVDVLSEGSSVFQTELLTRVPSNLVGYDAGNLGSADLAFNFDPAIDESGISSYRIFANTSTSPIPDIDSLLSIPADRYVEIVPAGGPYSGSFDGRKDVLGNAIDGAGTYWLFGISVGDNTAFIEGDVVPGYAEPVELLSVALEAEILSLDQDSIAADASAFLLNFDKADDETGIAAYRIYLSPPMLVNLDLLRGLAADRYQTVLPTGTSHSIRLESSLKDVNGNELGTDINYRAYILSEPDSVSVNVWGYANQYNSAKIPSELFAAYLLEIQDIENLDSGADFYLNFYPPLGDPLISEYRAFIDKAGSPPVDTATAAALTSDKYVSFIPDGGFHSTIFTFPGIDIQGDPLQGEGDYRAYVMSVLPNTNVLRSVDLSPDLNPLRATELELYDEFDFGDARDFRLFFAPPVVFDRVESYRIFVLDNADPTPFTLTDAITAPPDQYFEVLPPFDPDNIMVDIFPASLRTAISGAPITTGVTYKMVILTTTTPATNSVQVLSTTSTIAVLEGTGAVGLNGADAKQLSVTVFENTLLVNSPNHLIEQLLVSDIQGRQVHVSKPLSREFAVESQNWPNGIYFVSVTIDGSVMSQKVVLAR